MNHMWKKRKHNTIYVAIVLVSAILFIPFIGSVHLFDWDEINFAESAREMIVSGDYLNVQINYSPFWEKPPLFFWIQTLSMKILGVNEFAARFPNALVGIFTLLMLFNIGNKLYDKHIGILWALVYAGSVLPFFYFKSGIIDPLFNLFIFLGIYEFFLFASKKSQKKYWNVFLSAMFIGLANLTKGPVALLIFLLTVFLFMLIRGQYKHFLYWKTLMIYLLTFGFFGGFWFIIQILTGNYSVLVDFIQYMFRLLETKDAGHGGFLGYHFVVLLIGVFPASIFAIYSLIKNRETNQINKDFRLWMLIVFWVVVILFSIVKSKIVHYSSLCYFPITFFAVLAIKQLVKEKIHFTYWMKGSLTVITLFWGMTVGILRYFEKYKQNIIELGWIKDPFAIGNLQAQVDWHPMISIIGVLYMAGMIYCIWFYKKQNHIKFYGMFVLTLIFMECVVILVVPRIELYSQHAAIEFFKKRVGENCYVNTYGYKSYAHYFYAQVLPHQNKKAKDDHWLLSGKADKTVYISTTNYKQAEFEKNYPHFKLIEQKNGFIFYRWKTVD